jgi:uncharacterized protein YeaO (DUF488 family)
LQIRVASINPASVPFGGARLLVDRDWPSCARKGELALTAWLQDVAPSPGLGAWFDHSPAQWNRFCDRYFRELESKPQEIEVLFEFVRVGPVLLICAACDRPYNSAAALKEFVCKKMGSVGLRSLIASA